jgi:hypothetical protein
MLTGKDPEQMDRENAQGSKAHKTSAPRLDRQSVWYGIMPAD